MIDLYSFIGPVFRSFEPERAHHLAILALRGGLVLPANRKRDPRLAVSLWGLNFPNPVGLAAGFDKNAEAVGALLALGFGFVEIGTVTPRPQRGNPRPRVFRLPADAAMINRLGFNNDGMVVVGRRLARWRDSQGSGIVGINVGPNRDSEDPTADCALAVRTLAPFADYLVINVSSPNTPGLRDLQRRDALTALICRVLEALGGARPPLIVKISPDTSKEERIAIAEIAVNLGLDGLTATNTTIARSPTLTAKGRDQSGGLSGRPLFQLSTDALRHLHATTGGKLPLVGVGGIASARDAWGKIRAGASLVQLYTALIYQGPALVTRINEGLVESLERDSLTSIADAVGTDHALELPTFG